MALSGGGSGESAAGVPIVRACGAAGAIVGAGRSGSDDAARAVTDDRTLASTCLLVALDGLDDTPGRVTNHFSAGLCKRCMGKREGEQDGKQCCLHGFFDFVWKKLFNGFFQEEHLKGESFVLSISEKRKRRARYQSSGMRPSIGLRMRE
jgi:hypothetical protein